MIGLKPQLRVGNFPDKGKFIPHPLGAQRGLHKPKGGIWTSTLETAFESGWPWWCKSENYSSDWDEAWILYPEPCRVKELNTQSDAIEFLQKYGIDPYRDKPELKWRKNSWSDHLPVWESVMEDWDAVRVTENYFDWRLDFSAFYGWDCESTVWLSWQFKREPERWTK